MEQADKIVGQKVCVRPILPSDTEDMVRWRNKDWVRKNFIYQKQFTKEGHLEWLKTMVDTGRVKQFIIQEKETNRAIGSANLKDIDLEHSHAEYGIFIGEEDALSKGYGTEVAQLLIEYAFTELKLHKVTLRVLAANIGAVRSYEKAGFIKEAYLKDEVCLQGKYCDLLLMGVINPS